LTREAQSVSEQRPRTPSPILRSFDYLQDLGQALAICRTSGKRSRLHLNVLASTGAPFSIVEGTPTETGPRRCQQNWRIDVECLLRGLDELGAL